jgi:hypothetical protein
MRLWYGTFYMPRYKQSSSKKSVFDVEHALLPTRQLTPMHVKVPYRNCIYVRLPVDEPSGSKHLEDKKN